MFLGLLLALLIANPAPASAACAEVYLTEEQALGLAFPDAEIVERKLVLFTQAEREAIARASGRSEVPGTFRYFLGRRSGEVIGFAVIEDCLGKSEPITYMVATDGACRIRTVEILAYRESHGGEVRQPRWRGQFVGRSAESPLRVGTDIRNIAGATISCRSVTDAVRLQIACLEAARRASSRSSEVAEAAAPQGRLRRARLAMGTTLAISVCEPTAGRAGEAIDAAFAEIERLERILSTFRPESEASRLNHGAGGEPQPVGPELLDLLSRSRQITLRSGGAFDVTVGPLVALWKRSAESGALPTENDLTEARAACGLAVVETDPEHGRVRLARPGAALDFGGIGKGYALDRAAAALEDRGVHRALLDFGGQILALDPPPGEAGWTVELRDFRDPRRTRGSLRLVRASISTTADYERGLDIAGKPSSHVLDPRTGSPVEGMLGASVVCPTATEADALSTAIFVLGPRDGVELARRSGAAALLVPTEGAEIANDAFRALEIRREEPR
ncbi:MAG: FAD:protein FMN transferase [Planctomycetota bacterium]